MVPGPAGTFYVQAACCPDREDFAMKAVTLHQRSSVVDGRPGAMLLLDALRWYLRISFMPRTQR